MRLYLVAEPAPLTPTERTNMSTTAPRQARILTIQQQTLLDSLRKIRESETNRVRQQRHQTREAVLEAMSAGVPARIISEVLGLTPGRIYQLRDEARANAIASKITRTSRNLSFANSTGSGEVRPAQPEQ